MAYKYLLFDLDGTVIDSGSGVITSVKYALEKSGYEIPETDVLRKFIGPPLDYSFENFIGMSKEEAALAVSYYREYYKDKGIFDCVLYEGIREALADLKSSGYKIMLATSKPEVFAKRIIEHFSLLEYFDLVAGALFDDSRKNKDQVIEYVLESVESSDIRSDVLMIGDRLHDIEGAHTQGIKCLAVLYGYGSLEEFKEYSADYIAERVLDIPCIVKSL